MFHRFLFKAVWVVAMTSGTFAFAEADWSQEWVAAMNACETLVSDQSFSGFQAYGDAQSILKVDPKLERGFRHPDLQLNASAISVGSEWALCVVTGDTGPEHGTVIVSLIATLFEQSKQTGNHAMFFDDKKTLAPVRVICRGDGQLTSVQAYYYGDEHELRVAAVNRLPRGAKNPC